MGSMMRHHIVQHTARSAVTADGDLVREPDNEALAALDHGDAYDARPTPAQAVRRALPPRSVMPRRPPPPRAEDIAAPTRKGRGAAINPANRFEAQEAAPFDDGWSTLLEDLPPLATTLTRDASRSVISWNQSPDLGFDRAVNPYRGCEHGCVYCFARPTHAYLGHSPGLDFETKLTFKPDVAELLEKELRKPGYVVRPMALGTNTDPYQPVERTLKLTRAVLQVLDRCNHPLTIVTKSAGVVRDLDILAGMAKRNLVRVWLSVTTLDPTLARCMEPRAAAPARRLQAVTALAQAGVPVGVLAAPMIPGLNDAEMERILEAAARARASTAGYILLRLPHEIKQIFEDWLHRHVPERASHVLELIRNTRGGALYDAKFGQRMSGSGPYADLLAQRFARAARQFKLEERKDLDCAAFVPPGQVKRGFAEQQMSLF